MERIIPNNPELQNAIQQVAKLFKTPVTIETRLVLSIPDAPANLENIVNLMLEPHPGATPVVILDASLKAIPASNDVKMCPYCGKPARKRGITCGTEECQKKHQKKYMQLYNQKKTVLEGEQPQSQDIPLPVSKEEDPDSLVKE